ncbi:MAG: hypothetical protein ACR2F2_03965 [Pyrinomonadaceae bacterium]
MSKQKNPAEVYAEIILNDEREKILKETPTVYNSDKIERIYEFHDGAVVSYEWQSFTENNSAEKFNHRFTLTSAPSPNPHKLKSGVIKTIDYSGSGR